MSWTYELKPSAAKSLEKLESSPRQTIIASLERLCEELTSQGHPVLSNVAKMKGSPDKYRLRAGDWRVIFKFEAGRLVVLVLDLGHRRDVYK